MTAADFLADVRAKGVILWREDDRLRIRAPKELMVAEMLDGLRERKAELLELLAEEEAGNARPFALSEGQQGIWSALAINPDRPDYNVHAVLRIGCGYDGERIGQALDALAARHPMLRARFRQEEGEPRQWIDAAGRFPLERRTVDGLEAEALDRLVDAEIDTPFDLAEGAVRALLLEWSEQGGALLVVTAHHLIADFWSLGLIVRDLAAAYDRLGRGQQVFEIVDVPEFRDFIASRNSGPKRQQDLEFWDDQLLHGLPECGLPRTSGPIGEGTPPSLTVTRMIDASTVAAVRASARSLGVTPFAIMLAAFQATLARFTEARETIVGIPFAGRTERGADSVVGHFVTLLPLRSGPIAGSLASLAEATAAAVAAAVGHQDVGYETLAARYPQHRRPGRTPLFDIVFNWNKEVVSADQDGGGLISAFVRGGSMGASGASHDLVLSVIEHAGEGMSLRWTHRPSAYDAFTIESFAESYLVLLAAGLEDMSAAIANLPLMDPARTAQVLAEYGVGPSLSLGETIVRRFEANAAAMPRSTAVIDADGGLSFQELDAQSNKLAHYLRESGIGPGKLVAIRLPRSIDYAVAALAVMKAGAAYVPIDITQPPARVEEIAREADVDILLMRSQDAMEVGSGRYLSEFVDLIAMRIAHYPTVGLEVDIRPEWPAYVIFTSGTTGTPKGAITSHRALSNVLDWGADLVGAGPGIRSAQLTSNGFDASAFDIWPPLVAGGQVRFITPDEMVAPERLPAMLDSLSIDTAFLPTTLYELIPCDAWDSVERPMIITVGGSALRTGTPRNPKVRLINVYGPTETAIMVSTLEVRTSGVVRHSLGTPLANARIRLLDRRMRPVPPGAAGEIYIGGVVVGANYIGKPALTAGSFIPDAFADQPGDRQYRTGDYARFLPNGEIDFLGRRDGQVKFAGFRVELGEIEQKLMSIDAVAAAGAAVDRSSGHERLVAAYVASEAGEPDPQELLSNLAGMLPGYMIPTLLAPLSELPLTRNGKLDRDALVAMLAGATMGGDSAEPRTEMETRIASLWAEVLQVGHVGLHTSFFELGGHSMLAIRLVDRINGLLGTSLRVGDLMKLQTVSAVAEALTGSRPAEDGAADTLPGLSERAESSRYDAFPLTDTQYAYWIGRSGMFDLGNVATHIYTEMNLRTFDVDEVNAIWNKLIARHDMLRAVISLEGTQRVLRDVPDYLIAVDDLTDLAPDEAEARLAATRERMSHQVFDPQHWPLFEIRLSKLADDRFRLHTSMDALIADAGSFAIIENEYNVIARGEAETLPPLRIGFRDYVLAERQLASTPAFDRARDYWLDRLDGLPPAPDLPLARDPQMLSSGRFVRHEGILDEARWSALKETARRLHVTPTSVLLGAFSEVLRLWSHADDFTLNLTLFNRVPFHPDVNNLVGDFTSLILLQVDGSGAGFGDRVQAIQSRLWDDIENRLYTGVQVLRELSRRNSGRTVTMPVVFTSLLPLGEETGQATQAPGEESSAGFTITQTSQVWIDHVASELNGSLHFHWDVVDELFPAGMIEAMVESYENLLRRLVDDEASWSGGRLPPPAEQIAVREAVNATAAPISGERMEDAVLASAQATPDAPAVLWDDGVMTYGELRARAFHLAARLRAEGAAPNQLVGIVHPRGWQQAAAALGIQIAGAAYLPIDPEWPVSRQREVLKAAGARIVVTSPELADAMPNDIGLTVLTIDRDPAAVSEERVEPVGSDEDVAYVIFTSGSTGRPKGVTIDHRGAVNTIRDINQRFSIGPADRALGLSALSFDLSVYDIFGLLAAGGALVAPGDDEIRNPECWQHHLREHRVTIINAVPSFLQMLVDYCEVKDSGALRELRLVMMSGDWIPVALPTRLRAIAPSAEVVSLGGATEASIWSVFHPIRSVDPSWASIPYGTPLANQTLHVLREDFSPCPDWVSGDLYIGGIGLALGYWGDSERTAESFVVHPGTGERLYRTGDLARYTADGVLEFLGRRDGQVKVRGHRIELGEIETVLASHESVIAAAAIAVGTGEDRRLNAFVVPRPGVLAELRLDSGSPLDFAADEAVVDDETYLDDVGDRIMFKFAGHGRRRLPAEAERIPLRAERDPDLALYGVESSAASDDRALRALLATMQQREIEDSPIAKRLYPSAGSLYPIQLHVSRGAGGDGIRGDFYYDPEEDALVRLGAGGDRAGTEFLLVAEDAAIRPLYGTSARGFCLLEAGYIAQLLDGAARAGGYRVERSPTDEDDSLRARLGLRASQWLAARLRLVPAATGGEPPLERRADWLDRQSYRDFETQPLDASRIRGIFALLAGRPMPDLPASCPLPLLSADVAVQLFVKPGRVKGMRPGLYDVDVATGSLNPAAATGGDMAAAFPGDTAALYAAGAFVLLVRGDPNDEQALFAAGAIGQQLMLAAGLFDLGFCPIGQLRQDQLQSEFPEREGRPTIHSLVGGSVLDSARHRWIQIDRPNAESIFAGVVADHAREHLPTYMVPDSISLLDHLPLSANGKIDRAALSKAEVRSLRQEGGYVAPRTPAEQRLVEIFADVLECERVGVLDDFFALGGNSVRAVQAFRKIATALNSDLQISDIFQFSNVRQLAERIDSLSGSNETDTEGSGERSAQQRAAMARQRGRLRRQPGEAEA